MYPIYPILKKILRFIRGPRIEFSEIYDDNIFPAGESYVAEQSVIDITDYGEKIGEMRAINDCRPGYGHWHVIWEDHRRRPEIEPCLSPEMTQAMILVS